jgi:hypothetical protein
MRDIAINVDPDEVVLLPDCGKLAYFVGFTVYDESVPPGPMAVFRTLDDDSWAWRALDSEVERFDKHEGTEDEDEDA